jgi:hypothetical protein
MDPTSLEASSIREMTDEISLSETEEEEEEQEQEEGHGLHMSWMGLFLLQLLVSDGILHWFTGQSNTAYLVWPIMKQITSFWLSMQPAQRSSFVNVFILLGFMEFASILSRVIHWMVPHSRIVRYTLLFALFGFTEVVMLVNVSVVPEWTNLLCSKVLPGQVCEWLWFPTLHTKIQQQFNVTL